jgi:hypothetical protein
MRYLLAFAIALTALGCASHKQCENTPCSAMFAIVSVIIKDTTNIALTGISTETILLSSRQTIHTQPEPGSPDSSFIVVDDSDIKEIGYTTNQNVELKIMKDGKVVKSVPFTINTDCCHVSKASGPESVLLN